MAVLRGGKMAVYRISKMAVGERGKISVWRRDAKLANPWWGGGVISPLCACMFSMLIVEMFLTFSEQ